MNAKEYLSQAYHLDRKISYKLDQVKLLRDFASKANNVLSDMPKGSDNYKLMERNIAAMVDLEREIDDDVKNLLYLKKSILMVIKNIYNPEYRTLLELRYLQSKKWSEISTIMGCSLDNVYKIHRNALKACHVPKQITVNYSKF